MDDNLLIEKFINNEAHIPQSVVRYLRHNTSWEWLMLAVEKIESLNIVGHRYEVFISSNRCCIQDTKFRSDIIEEPPLYFSEHYGKDKLEATYSAVVSFIKWYNEQRAAV